MKAIKIFYCYAHEDKDLRDKLVKHLAPLRRGGQINEWSDREILPGVDWELEIETQLNAANIILLLVSSDFMNSNYCYNKEMLRALERQKNGESRVLPIILRPVFWENNFINELQQLPTDGKPLTTWSNIDEGFKDITTGIFSVIEEMRKADEVHVKEVVSERAREAEKVARAEQVERISNRQNRDELIREKARVKRAQKDYNISELGENADYVVPHARRSTSVSFRTNDTHRKREWYWLNVLFPVSAHDVKQSFIFSVTESSIFSTMLGFELVSWFWFLVSLLLVYMLINISITIKWEGLCNLTS